ncbi:MAG: uroporphyrinogen-III C-methyltransferase [Campylobacteraceae bacterium]|jgi:uroporphyrin-III C-methyltransferase/precorrin-2 dehydrogenase/sirohydrochlorin ferrochelatase|nr:uroporphyrinogen-III C-methyltransferase [Campylobacteraceae bacterium]
MNILPVALTPKKVLLIGAGKAAALKAKSVRASDCALTIVAKEITDAFFEDKEIIKEAFSFAHLADHDVVINATGDESLSKLLWESRKGRGFLLNCVDMPKYCDFYFGAVVKDHDLCVSVSTGGASPKYAQFIRGLIAAVLPKQSKKFYENIKAKRERGDTNIHPDGGKVLLIGCGPGSADNLTIKALKALSSLQIAMIDALVGKEVIELLPKNCIKIDVSKTKGCHKFLQDEINEMLLKYAKDGLRVGRLKGGDPAVFGRVYEEAAFLSAEGVQVEMINGVSSVFAGCLAGGVTPTLRGFSAGALIVSAHLRESKFNDDWVELLKSFSYTVIVLMAYSFADKIVKKAKEVGVSSDIPTAFISKIDSPEQTTVIGTLGQLEEMAKLCDKPAILVIGEAVSQASKMPCSGKRIFLKTG